MLATEYLPEVAWRTICNDVYLLTEQVGSTPATYRLNVYPIDVNDLGALPTMLEEGFYLKDYVGHTYTIIQVNTLTIDVLDDFLCGEGPQSGQNAIIYQSVDSGRSPYLAPIYYRHLDRRALDYSRRFELDILWRGNNPKAGQGTLSLGVNTVTFEDAFHPDQGYVLWVYTYDDNGYQVGHRLMEPTSQDSFEIQVPKACNYKYIATPER